MFDAFAVQDGNLITGQQQNSGAKAAELVVAELARQKGKYPTYVLVHGAWADESAWGGVRNQLALRANVAVVNLPAHGADNTYGAGIGKSFYFMKPLGDSFQLAGRGCRLFPLVFACLFFQPAQGQSLELMAGGEGAFFDLQWLKPFDQTYRWTLFSRTRMTLAYDNTANLFSGAYFNFTTQHGIGASLIGKVSQIDGAGADLGVHFFKTKPDWTLFALASIGLKNESEYSWFSIFRFTPEIKAHWKIYAGLELFHLYNKNGHSFSVERLRLGLDWKGLQFGIAGNFQQIGTEFKTSDNIGGFVRKAF